jgi:gliding motility-associated-like protein
LWNNGQTTSTATGLGSGNYTVTVTDAAGCTQTQTVSVTQQPGPTATVGATTTITLGSSTSLSASGGVTYSWVPSTGLSNPNISNPIASPAVTTEYCVYVFDAGGCFDSACVWVFVEMPCIMQSLETLLPNAFSPNADGENDQLCVPNNACIVSFVLKIYDRWGEKVFETDNVNDCWDGMYKGRALNTAVFVYYLEAKLSNGETIKQKGNISLAK